MWYSVVNTGGLTSKKSPRWDMDSAALLRGGSGVSEAHRWRGRLHHIATTRRALSERGKAELETRALPIWKFARREVLNYVEYCRICGRAGRALEIHVKGSGTRGANPLD